MARIFSDLEKAEKMAGNGEALNVLVFATVIWAFFCVYIDFDVLPRDSFLRFSKLYHNFVQNSVPETNMDDGRDYLDLATIVSRCFEDKQEVIPTELRLFLSYISTTNPSRLLNIENHPIFLSPLQRLCYRVIAHTFLYFGNAKKRFSLALNRRLSGHKWKHMVGKFGVVFNRHKCLQNLQRKKFKYNQSAMSFLRFGRNVVAHLKDNFGREPGTEILTAEKVEEELNGYWPEFMPVLHQVLVEHGHLMLVHDAVLT